MTLGFASLGQYGAASHALMQTPGRLTSAMIRDALGDAGLDVAAAEAAYRGNRAKWDAYLARNARQAAMLELGGTPSFIIGRALYPGAMSRSDLAKAVRLARG